jgi:glycosyltransferase involved in cell wall biosynthesis
MLAVSAVIPSYNYARHVGEAIESVLGQTLPAHEILVIDDGSTDDTPAVAARYGNKIHYVRTKNQGVSAARNEGIKRATGDLIAFLDADDRWLPHKLERQVPLFADPTVGLAHTGCRVFDGATEATLVEPIPQKELAFHELLNCCAVSLSSAMVPRRVFAEVGGFHPAFSNAADWDMWIRIARNHQVTGCPEVLVEYRSHTTSMSQGNEYKQFCECLAVLEKNSGHHQNCAACAEAIRSAQRRLRLEYYGVSTAVARARAREGKRLESVLLRLRTIWQQPQLLLMAPVIIRNWIAARNEARRLKAAGA